MPAVKSRNNHKIKTPSPQHENGNGWGFKLQLDGVMNSTKHLKTLYNPKHASNPTKEWLYKTTAEPEFGSKSNSTVRGVPWGGICTGDAFYYYYYLMLLQRRMSKAKIDRSIDSK